MSDMYDQLIQQASASFKRSCTQQRYKTAWLVGGPRSGKTTLAKQIAYLHDWTYINYTHEPGYFDSLASTITIYQPETLATAVEDWCSSCRKPVLILDEIDALLAVWSPWQRESWASAVSKKQFLPSGLVLVSSFFDTLDILRLLPDTQSDYCISLTGVPQ